MFERQGVHMDRCILKILFHFFGYLSVSASERKGWHVSHIFLKLVIKHFEDILDNGTIISAFFQKENFLLVAF